MGFVFRFLMASFELDCSEKEKQPANNLFKAV